jgi:hypothetical protein
MAFFRLQISVFENLATLFKTYQNGTLYNQICTANFFLRVLLAKKKKFVTRTLLM